jgi:ubiquinone/menaquinone biosynthesis C-methylase UbiE
MAKRDSNYIVTLLNPLVTDSIADLGAGYGYIASRVSDRTKLLIAIEPDQKRAKHMHQTYPALDCIRAVGEAIPCRASFFDKSYAKKSLHHAADINGALKELNRIIKPTGFLVIQEPRPEGRWKLVEWIERRMRHAHMDFQTPDALKKRLEEVGFSVKFLENKANGYYVMAEKKAA